jgi:tetratricopeptide (TPR) repeat protein
MRVFLPLLALSWPAPADGLETALQLYGRTEYRQALDALEKAPDRSSPAAVALAGQCWYQLGDFKRAVEKFERAASARPDSSVYANWLGRAYGRRAETANPLSAPGHAVKARKAFERAVELDPSSLTAMDDLFSYYIEAPGFLGGGLDKAEALAERMKSLDPASYHSAAARLAERRRQPDAAERQLRRAIELAPKSAARLVDLARYLARQGRHGESDQLFARARKAEPASKHVLYAQAEVYVEARRSLTEARKLLEEYLSGPLTPDDPSRSEALRLLEKAR